jgi:hypothetical protein
MPADIRLADTSSLSNLDHCSSLGFKSGTAARCFGAFKLGSDSSREATAMRGLLVVLVLVIVGVIAVGYYRDWFKVGGASDSKAVNVNVTVDKEKIKEDEQKAKQKLKEVGGQIKEKTGEIIGGARKGAGEKKPGD